MRDRDDRYDRSRARRPPNRGDKAAAERFRELDRRAKEEEAFEKKEKKRKRKRLINLISNEALCLLVIFALIGLWNYIAGDFAGEYVAHDRSLGLVKISLVRNGDKLNGELVYAGSPCLYLQGDFDQQKPKQRLVFETDPELRLQGKAMKAVFLGTVTSSEAKGTLVDAQGKYKLKLEKNLLASLFRLIQNSVPVVPAFRPPSWVNNEKPKSFLEGKPASTASSPQSEKMRIQRLRREAEIKALNLGALKKQIEQEKQYSQRLTQEDRKRFYEMGSEYNKSISKESSLARWRSLVKEGEGRSASELYKAPPVNQQPQLDGSSNSGLGASDSNTKRIDRDAAR
jgi:hypothetical protein